MGYPDYPTDSNFTVLHWRSNAVAHIKFNRPTALNAINRDMAGRFLQACQDIAADPEVRAVRISGEGRAFMVGGDIVEMRADPMGAAQELIKGMHGGIGLLTRMNAPVIAEVHGAVAGGAMGLVLACDLLIAAEGTRFGVAYPQIGASCDCSTSWGLPRIIGLRKALEFALLGDTITAEDALGLGLVNRVVAADQLATTVDGIVQRLAAGPTQALGRLKRLLRASLQNDLETQLEVEALGFLTCSVTADFQEGVNAFLEKRTPHFIGV